jgi:hypothetical protein
MLQWLSQPGLGQADGDRPIGLIRLQQVAFGFRVRGTTYIGVGPHTLFWPAHGKMIVAITVFDNSWRHNRSKRLAFVANPLLADLDPHDGDVFLARPAKLVP